MRTIALDFTSLDRLKISNGQYRYGVDLIRGLSRMSGFQFVLLGSRPEPPPEVTDVFRTNPNWKYRRLAHATYRGGYFVDHLKFGTALLKWRIDLLHALHSFVPRFCPCRVVVTEHDLMFDLFDEYASIRRSRPYRWYCRSLRKAERVIAISQNTARDLTALRKIDPRQIDVVYHGTVFASVPGEVIENRVEAEADVSPTLLSPYNLEPRKNLRTLLEAVAILKPIFPKLRLVLFGRAACTPAREKLFESQLDTTGVRGQVVRLGFVGDSELCALYRRSTVFVFPSMYEGFGLPILEAMAQGACVIARNASAMAEIVSSAGLLVETANAAELAGAIRHALDCPEERERIGGAARERARQFTIDRMASETAACYQRAFDGMHAPDTNAHRS